MYIRSIMRQVIECAKSSNNIPVCAAIAVEDRIISILTNNSSYSFEHAEFLVITDAIKILSNKYLDSASIYITLEPCILCSSLLLNVRIKDIFFGAYSVKTGSITHGKRIFDNSTHTTNIVGGLYEDECANIMQNFFKSKRH